MAKSVLQDWVTELGLRHQGVLLTAVRGCDTAPKHDSSKLLVRSYRATILNCHCGDPAKAATFIERVPDQELLERMNRYRKNLDHYPHHYVMHLMHASAIVGYKNRVDYQFGFWLDFYLRLCKGLHVNPESEQQLDERLNATEEEFKARDQDAKFDAFGGRTQIGRQVQANEKPDPRRIGLCDARAEPRQPDGEKRGDAAGNLL